MKHDADSGDEEVMTPADQMRLDAWLEAARNADVTSPEDAAADASPQRRAEHVRRLAENIDLASQQKAAIAKRRARAPWYAFAVAACFALVAASAGLGAFDDDAEETPAVAESGASLRQVVGTVIATRPDGQNQIVSAETVVALGDEISTTAEGFASLEAGKARVDLSSATTVALEELAAESQTFHLHAGRVDVSVPKVPGVKRQVKVRTSNALVVVYGTVFSVEVAKRDGKEVTSVGVSRGLVSVDHAGARIMLGPGSQWNSVDGLQGEDAKKDGEDASPTPPTPETDEPKEGQVRSAGRVRAASSKNVANVGKPAVEEEEVVELKAESDLAAQNRLFERAMNDRDAGNDELAVSRLRELLATYPKSPLRTTARAELRAAMRRQKEATKGD